MIVTYRTHKLEKACTILEEAEKQYGIVSGTKLHQRIQQLLDADTVKEKKVMPIYKSHTYVAFPPGETIKESLESWKISKEDFASRMDMTMSEVDLLLEGEIALTPDMANKLEKILNMGAYFWNRLEKRYRENISKVNAENAFTVAQTWRQTKVAVG